MAEPKFNKGDILELETNRSRNTLYGANEQNGAFPDREYEVISDDFYDGSPGRLITVRDLSTNTYKPKGVEFNLCAFRLRLKRPATTTSVTERPLNRWGQPIFEVGDRIEDKSNYPRFTGVATVTKVYTHSDDSITLYFVTAKGVESNYSSHQGFKLHKETETMTTTNIPTNQAQVGDIVLVEGTLTRGPDGEGDFAIRFEGKTLDQFVPAKAVRQIVKRPPPEPKFKKGERVKMDPNNYSFNTSKRGTVIAEHNGTYFVDWGLDGMNTVVEKNLRKA